MSAVSVLMLYRMIPTPKVMSSMVNIWAEGFPVIPNTSPYPTVVKEITVIYKQSRKLELPSKRR
jgi:hypothetical protein